PVGWPDGRGISGRMRVEWVAGSPWNRWSDAHGMGGQMTVESAGSAHRVGLALGFGFLFTAIRFTCSIALNPRGVVPSVEEVHAKSQNPTQCLFPSGQCVDRCEIVCVV
ncbi:hypothetical protein, partial [Pseudomonas aeruginosa]|uniref:hypothetical protein n=1 Tax=Pseudomonas aeruginosa TaxID=287 RepID=UPI001E2AE2C9